MSPLTIQIWSDIACPWCLVGKRRLEAALARTPAPVDIRWRSFELDPTAPRTSDPAVPYAERIARKYGSSLEAAEGMIRTMVDAGASVGVALRFDLIRPGNTFDAHRVLHHAAERGLADAAKERFLVAYLCEGAAIGDVDVLARLAREIGLDADEVRGVLESDAHAAAVRADEAEGRALGVNAVPHFRFGEGDEALGVPGAQPPEVLHDALEGARRAQVEACGPDGCA